MKQKMFLAVIVFAAAITLSGCGCTEWASKKAGEKIMEKGIEAQTGAKVDIDSGNGTSTIKTGDGSMAISEEGNAKLPENFPKDVFVYGDAKITMAITSATNGEGYSISYTTGAAVNDVFSKYKQEMEKNGWKKDSEADMGADGKMLNYSKGKSQVLVMIGANTDNGDAVNTSVGLTVSTDNSSDTDLQSVGGGAQE